MSNVAEIRLTAKNDMNNAINEAMAKFKEFSDGLKNQQPIIENALNGFTALTGTISGGSALLSSSGVSHVFQSLQQLILPKIFSYRLNHIYIIRIF